MLPVVLAAEPDEFNGQVREHGETFLNSLQSLDNVDFRGKEYWRRAIPSLRHAYHSICAYTCHWISDDTGAGSADHFIARKANARLAYEWSNLRYCCSRLNSRKGIRRIIDPFDVVDGMFEIVFPSLHLRVGDDFADDDLLEQTIKFLRLNDETVVAAREEYANQYAGGMHIGHVRRYAPLLYHEIRRQSLSRGDLVEMGFGPPAAILPLSPEPPA